MPIITLTFPTGSDEEMVFTTFHGYLAAICNWTRSLYPHPDGLVPGLAVEVGAQPWKGRTPARSRSLSRRAGELMRNGWATEVLLNSPRILGGGDLIGFANLWAPVQAYYAIFEALTALVMTTSSSRPPKTHASLLQWAGSTLARPGSPFVVPWTARVLGAPGDWQFEGFGGVPIQRISNLSSPTATNAPHLLALGIKTTREEQIEDRRESWLKGSKTKAGTKRKNLPRAQLLANATAMRPTTLFDLLWRLRVRSNYKEGDALLSGALGPSDAADFHDAFCEIVAATLLPIEIYLAHVVGQSELRRCAAALPVPLGLEDYSVRSRIALW